MAKLTHLDDHGNARMVDVSHKPATAREALAEGWLHLSDAALASLLQHGGPKGNALTVAQIAGIQGAKRTSDLIPLCHPLPLSSVKVHLTPHPERQAVRVHARAKTTSPTGVEMEALTAVSTALLTLYDMLKAVDRAMTISGVRLLEKHGGASGSWLRQGSDSP